MLHSEAALPSHEDRSTAEAGQTVCAHVEPLAPGAGLLRAVGAVAASFFGVRGRKEHEADLAQLRPVHLVLVGLLMSLVFVLSLFGLVTLVLRV
jgi:hypothetical protein